MTELRQKMVRAMELKNLFPHTQRAYLAAVKGLACDQKLKAHFHLHCLVAGGVVADDGKRWIGFICPAASYIAVLSIIPQRNTTI